MINILARDRYVLVFVASLWLELAWTEVSAVPSTETCVWI